MQKLILRSSCMYSMEYNSNKKLCGEHLFALSVCQIGEVYTVVTKAKCDHCISRMRIEIGAPE